jgi:cephalosporin hydroxylase
MKFKKYNKSDAKWDLVKGHAFCKDVPNPFLQVLYLYKDKIKDLNKIDLAIETGTYLGDSAVIFADCFSWVFTVEKMPVVSIEKGQNPIDLLERYIDLRVKYPNISFNFSDSVSFLHRTLSRYSKHRFVFLLDAHTLKHVPIIEELEKIKICSGRNDHVLIIDDTAEMKDRTRKWPTKNRFETAIMAINHDYKIEYTSYGNGIVIVYEEKA